MRRPITSPGAAITPASATKSSHHTRAEAVSRRQMEQVARSVFVKRHLSVSSNDTKGQHLRHEVSPGLTRAPRVLDRELGRSYGRGPVFGAGPREDLVQGRAKRVAVAAVLVVAASAGVAAHAFARSGPSGQRSVSSQCDLPVAQRVGGWFCPGP